MKDKAQILTYFTSELFDGSIALTSFSDVVKIKKLSFYLKKSKNRSIKLQGNITSNITNTTKGCDKIVLNQKNGFLNINKVLNDYPSGSEMHL